jgi:ABC-2 type transport system permease protein
VIETIRSEWIKLRTVRMNLVLFIIAVAFPVIVCVLVASLGDIKDLRVADVAGLVAGSSVITALLLGVVGAVSISAEFAYGTIRPTFAATPRRMRVLASKAVVIALFAVVAEALVVVICYALSSSIANSRGASISLSDDNQARAALIGIFVFAIIVSLLGFGLGMVIRNTPAAVAVLILWPLVAENIVFLILNAAAVSRPRRFLPYTSGFGLASTDPANHEGLSRIAGGVYFAVVTAAVAAVGAFITSRRDA